MSKKSDAISESTSSSSKNSKVLKTSPLIEKYVPPHSDYLNFEPI